MESELERGSVLAENLKENSVMERLWIMGTAMILMAVQVSAKIIFREQCLSCGV